MLVEKVLGNIASFPVGEREIDRVFLEWFELDKKLLRKTSELGEEIGVRLEGEGQASLQDGDVLAENDKRVIIVEQLPCKLTVVEVRSMKEMGRLCFELGNRHLTLAIEENSVSVPYDMPTFAYLDKLGFSHEIRTEKFRNFMVCKAHGNAHDHAQEHDRHAHHDHAHGHEDV